jgi:hypothetical protein
MATRSLAALLACALTAADLLAPATVLADEAIGPRRALDPGERAGRRAERGESAPRRGIEGEDAVSRRRREEEERKRKEEVVELLLKPSDCQVRKNKTLLKRLVRLKNPSESFNVEVWSDRRDYWVYDSILYFFRSNRDAYLTLFWIGPDNSIFIPFSNFRLEKNRDHKIDPNNIIVEPVGLERWRVIATLDPHEIPCTEDPDEVMEAMDRVQRQTHAIGVWEVRSHTYRERRTRLR